MAIDVITRCSDCGTVVDRTLSLDDPEIRCPECSRNMPNLEKDEFKAIERTQSSQRLMGLLAIFLTVTAIALLVLWMWPTDMAVEKNAAARTVSSWVSSDKPRDSNSLFLAGFGVCVLIAAVFGALAARRRYVVDF